MESTQRGACWAPASLRPAGHHSWRCQALMMSVKPAGDLPVRTHPVCLITGQRWQWSSGHGSPFQAESNPWVCVCGGGVLLVCTVAGKGRFLEQEGPAARMAAGWGTRPVGEGCHHGAVGALGNSVPWVHSSCSLSPATIPTNTLHGSYETVWV